MTTAFGGSNDKDAPLIDIVVEEVKEEAGFVVTKDRITDLGKVLVSTQMNQFCYLYMVDVTGLVQGERDLQEGEHGSSVKWLSEKDIITGEDWKSITIIMKYKAKQ